ncbi:MAG TPA: chain length determinant protein EpsF, partial [Burkholderiaceae bacterium]|nr:chain length determinant protein EpsF [Burkholderiaceae bacterium]
MNLTQLIPILLARWRTAAGVFAVLVLGVVVVTLATPSKYTATASVVADVKPDPVSAMFMQSAVTPAYIATQVDVIRSDRVAQRVVRNSGLADSAEVRAQWLKATQGEGKIEAWLADTLRPGLEVKPSMQSSIIEVSYKAQDPRMAANMANAFVQAYIEVTLDLKVDPARQYRSFFDTRAKEARERLEAAQAKLSAFQKENGIIATDERLDVENTRLTELSTQLVTLQALSAESSSRQNQAATSGDRIQEVLVNPVIGSLKSDLSRAEAKLQELNARYGENHPQVVEARANIAELKARVEAEVKRVTGGVGVAASINRAREADVRASLEAQRGKLLRMKALRDEGSVLLRDVENAQRAYDAIQTRLTQTNLESQTTLSNVNILTQAEPPLSPSSPKTYLNLLVGIFLGTALGLLAAVIHELLDRRLRSPQDLAGIADLP